MGFSQILFSWTAILPVIVLIYYFFRKKYIDQTVSSTLFWSEIMQETRVSPYLKHLQKNALLYLQMLALLLLVLALMNPYVKKSTIAGEQTIFIVDTSATMLAGKGESTFEAHRKEMIALIDELDGRPLTLITTGETPKAILQQETKTKEIAKVVNSLQVTYETEQVNKALDVAQAFIGETATSVYVFTDSLEKKELPIEKDSVKWLVRGAEKELENVAITRFAATQAEKAIMALVQLQNDTDKEQRVTLSIVDNENNKVVEETISIPKKEAISKTYKNLPVSSMMTATINVKDDYEIDNTSEVLLQTTAGSLVVDQTMHELVQRGFQALGGNVKTMPADQLDAVGSDATIVTNQVAMLSKAAHPMLLIGRDDEKTHEVNAKLSSSNDALFAFSALEDIYVRAVYPPFDGYKTIATVGDVPFIQRSPKGDIVVLADIEDTDWPLHPSFPLFLWSVENELAEGSDSLGIFTPNEERAVALSKGEWSIFSGEDQYLSDVTNGMLIAPARPGIYAARMKDDEKRFVVQLQQQERVIKNGTSFELGQVQVSGKEEVTMKSFVPWLICIILLILVMEWEVQRRRGFTN